jgi:hypothetical protein
MFFSLPKEVKMHSKKAQFYIIVTLIITLVVTGLITIFNYALVKPEPVQFYDLSKQLEREATRIIDYGVYSGQDIYPYIEDFISKFLIYAHEKDPDLGLIYIYGNESLLVVVNYGKDEAGVITKTGEQILHGAEAQAVSQITMEIGGQHIGKKIVEEKGIFGNIKALFGPSKLVKVTIAGKEYEFNLKGQQYFFAIVKSEKEGETYYQIID